MYASSVSVFVLKPPLSITKAFSSQNQLRDCVTRRDLQFLS